jgi:hypothetical protein
MPAGYVHERSLPIERIDTSKMPKAEERPAKLDTRAIPVMENELANIKGRLALNTERATWQKAANKELKQKLQDAMDTVKAAEALPAVHNSRRDLIAGAKAKAEKINDEYQFGLKHQGIYERIRDGAKKQLEAFDHERLAALKNLAAIEAVA